MKKNKDNENKQNSTGEKLHKQNRGSPEKHTQPDRAAQSSQTPARKIALEVLTNFDPKKQDAAQILNSYIHKTQYKAHITDLVFGCIRNLKLLDCLIEKISSRKTKQIQPKLLNILRIGAYEFVFSPARPDYAIISEAVNLIADKKRTGKKQAGFVNAILRNFQRSIVLRNAAPAGLTTTRTVPRTKNSAALFNIDIFPDPQTDPQKYLALAFSLPEWFTQKLINAHGFETAKSIAAALNRRPGIYLWPNTMKINYSDFVKLLNEEGVEFTPFDNLFVVKLLPQGPVDSLPGFQQGLFIVQDPAAAKVVNALTNIEPFRKIIHENQPTTANQNSHKNALIDLCAAPGTKSSRFAIASKARLPVIATDINPRRLKLIKDNIDRLQLSSIKTTQYDLLTDYIDSQKLTPAVVLADVPCSNTAVLARRPEARHRLEPQIIEQITKIQYEILKTVEQKVPECKTICYSTCSILEEENSALLRRFIANSKNTWTIADEKLTLPSTEPENSFDSDGGYYAVLKRK
jgi:16S rRNA (cytosine967-C5)-methyltransferase